jgi:hypothetical protein
MKTLVLALLLITSSAMASDDLVTHYEKSGYKATPRYAETIDYSKRLASASPWLHYTTFGKSPQGRDLPLLIADKSRRFEARRVNRKDKVVLMIQAGIHSGEIGGKDAGFLLLRDIAVDKTPENLLEHVTILFIPIFSVDGHERFGPYNRINQNGPEEMGWRVTAQNLNLNRDYLKADTPEIQQWLALFNEWEPDFFIDCHATDGADYQYTLTYLLDAHDNVDPGVADWNRNVFLKNAGPVMKVAGFEMFPYVYLLEWPNPKAGMRSWVSTPRFSTGYTVLQNRPGLLIETHMMKEYKTRVSATYQMLKTTAQLLNQEYRSLKEVNNNADRYAASAKFRKKPFGLQFQPDTSGVTIDFKGFAYEVETSELTGGPWYKFSDKPETFQIRYLDKQQPVVEVTLPEAYIIPPEWQDVIARLDVHGVQLRRLKEERVVSVDSYKFKDVGWGDGPFEGRFSPSLQLEDIAQDRVYAAGSVIVDMNQRRARVAAHILEPLGPDSYVFWGFFNAIFEQKEYSESYVMEKMAREMIARDDDLRREFEERKQNDADFAANPRWMLNWFYQHTPYWDRRKDVYPVGKIMDAKTLNALRESSEEV